MRWRSGPRQFGAALDGARREWAPETLLAQIQEIWADVVGAEIASEATPSATRGGTLTVSCAASVWAQELDLMGPEIVQRLNARVPSGAIERLRCVALPAGT